MKASDAKQFIGKRVKYRKRCSIYRYDTVTSTKGRNIFCEDDVLWAPDIVSMEEVPELSVPGNAGTVQL